MSLKSLIQALFERSGSQAMPGTSYVILSLTNTVSQTWVAPDDGYVRISAPTGASYLNVQEASVASVGFTSVDPDQTHYLVQTIPVRKGMTVMIGGYYGSHGVEGRFTRTVGSSVGGG